jgi:hypothetical protein
MAVCRVQVADMGIRREEVKVEVEASEVGTGSRARRASARSGPNGWGFGISDTRVPPPSSRPPHDPTSDKWPNSRYTLNSPLALMTASHRNDKLKA